MTYYEPGHKAIAFMRELLDDPVKQRAVFQYAEAKERLLDGFYDIDPWDYVDETTKRFQDGEFRKVNAQQASWIDSLEKELTSCRERLQALGIEPAMIDQLNLDEEKMMFLKESVQRSKEMNNNSNQTSALRKLPILRIHDTDFYVDAEQKVFRQVDNEKNLIAFQNVQDNGDHTSIMYDTKTKNAFRGSVREITSRSDVIMVQLPAAIDLDFDYVLSQLSKASQKIAAGQHPSEKRGATFNEKNRRQSKGTGL